MPNLPKLADALPVSDRLFDLAYIQPQITRLAAEIDRDLRQFIATGQRPEATRSAHSLKGIALSLGIERLGEMAADVERSLKDPTVSADQALVAPLLAELDSIRQVLQTLG